MKTLARTTSAAILAVASASASAWWGGPFNTITDDLFGDSWGALDMNLNVGTHTSGRGSGWNHNYSGPYAYGPYGYTLYPPAVPQAPADKRK